MTDKSEAYYLNRFVKFCDELNIDATRVLTNPPPILSAVVQEFIVGKIDEVGMMRCLRNLSIMNPHWNK